ncbi:hypothetical protein [Streptacidiphilus neutrinimicus]|uniref:hypothetical protein n=1 Tax=Streptacidiphilus neutrinimicus TaxID=105420 RepID=UPI000B047E49|nr:hypothetical protein [Streptacidiphilus neutrinimicus]
MFEYQLIVARTDELIAKAEHQRLVREVQRANKARKAGERRDAARSGRPARRFLHATAR